MRPYQHNFNNPAIHYRMVDLDSLRFWLRKPLDEAHRERLLALIKQKEAEVAEILRAEH